MQSDQLLSVIETMNKTEQKTAFDNYSKLSIEYRSTIAPFNPEYNYITKDTQGGINTILQIIARHMKINKAKLKREIMMKIKPISHGTFGVRFEAIDGVATKGINYGIYRLIDVLTLV
jgi:hypothetical protein